MTYHTPRDSRGRPLFVNDTVRYRGGHYTIDAILPPEQPGPAAPHVLDLRGLCVCVRDVEVDLVSRPPSLVQE